MTDTNKYQNIHFTADQPSTSDEFKGQPHQRVASTLARILSSSEGGRAIGLEGTWGSGKSTVIEMAKELLEKKASEAGARAKHSFFVFDAWAHQSDPLRRVFLEELIQTLTTGEKPPVNPSDWKEKLELLQMRRKKVTESKAEKLSLVAKASVLLFPLLPIAYLLLSKGLDAFPIQTPWTGTWVRDWMVALFIILLPYGFVAYTWLSWRNGFAHQKRPTDPKFYHLFSKKWWKSQERYRDKSIIWAFTKQTDLVTTDQFIKDEEATTIKFNNYFDELVNDASSRGHRIIVVFDNLDRLPNDLIQTTWATMRNFFAATPGTTRQETLKNVWLIVPFDRKHIKSAFSDGNPDDDISGFLEKTFEIVLRIAPPILSNWEQFLSEKLRSAFTEDITSSEAYQIFKVYEIYSRVSPRTITPRSLKAFVNTIVAQALQWETQIPLEHQAVYALYKDAIAENIEKLQDSSLIPESLQTQLVNRDLTKSLAAAHYAVDPSEAIEILLANEVGNLVESGNAERLSALSDTNGFSIILQNFVAEKCKEWSRENPTLLIDAASLLIKLKLTDDVRIDIWRCLAIQCNYITKPLSLNDNSVAGLTAIIENSPADQVKSASQKLLSALVSVKFPAPNQATGKSWYSLVEIIYQSIAKFTSSNEIKKMFSNLSVQGDLDHLLSVARNAADNKILNFSCFKPENSAADITARLSADISEPILPAYLGTVISAFLSNPSYLDWDQLLTAVRLRLQSPNPALTSVETETLLGIIVETRRLSKPAEPSEFAESAIKLIADDGTLHALLIHASSQNSESLIALLVGLIIMTKQTVLLGPPNHAAYGALTTANEWIEKFQASEERSEITRMVARILAREKIFHKIMPWAISTEKSAPLFKAILRDGVENGTYSVLDSGFVLENFGNISNVLGEELSDKFVLRFQDWNKSDWPTKVYPDNLDPLYLTTSNRLGAVHSAPISQDLKSMFSKMSTDQWKEALSKENNHLALLFALASFDNSIELPSAYFDSLKMWANDALDKGTISKRFSSKWPSLLDFLEAARRDQFIKTVRDRIIEKGASSQQITVLRKSFGEDFLIKLELQQNSEIVIRKTLDPILAEMTAESVDCIDQSIVLFSAIVEASDENGRQILASRLRDIRVGKDEKSSEKARSWAERWNLSEVLIEKKGTEEGTEVANTQEEEAP